MKIGRLCMFWRKITETDCVERETLKEGLEYDIVYNVYAT